MSGVRIAYLAAYAALAAAGEALVARPALLWLRGRGIFRAALPWDVPLGALAFLLALLIASFTIALAVQAGLGRRPRVPQHAGFLLLLALAFALRSQAGDPQPPRDPAPALLAGMRAVAAALDRAYHDGYTADPAQLEASLAELPAPGFRRLGRALPLRVHVTASEDAQTEPLAGDPPGTLYLALSRDRTAARITALSLHGILKLPSGKPALIEAHGGTHSLPGRDPLVPFYPGMRSVTSSAH